MKKTRRIPSLFWHWMSRLNRLPVSALQQGKGPSRLVLLLTTTGRKSGLARCTPLQFEQVDEVYYVASARGGQADWFRNLLANPRVQVQVQGEQFEALAEPVTDPAGVANFLALRLQRHPLMMRLMMAAEGLPWRFSRADLEQFAQDKAVVVLHPLRDADEGGSQDLPESMEAVTSPSSR